MPSCTYCESIFLFGGRKDATGHYCNERCQQAGNLLALSQNIPQREIDRLMEEVRRGNCPRCGGPGAVEVHKSHYVWSAIFITSWNTSCHLSCKSCATKSQLGAILVSGLFGWWGFPWGLGVTPMQIGRNIIELTRGDSVFAEPSALLQKHVRIHAAIQYLEREQSRRQNPTPPPIPRQPARQAPPPLPFGDERYMPKA